MRQLDVSGNKIDDEAVNDITQFLMDNDILERLNISYNRFNEQGTLTILSSLQSNETLKELRIHKMDSSVLARKRKGEYRESLAINVGWGFSC